MVGTFRVLKEGDAVFYEFWVIELEDDKVIFKMKHFDRGLLGWEEKADMVRLTLSASDEQDVLFSKPDGSLSLRYQRKGDELVSTLRRVKNGKAKVDIFRLHRSNARSMGTDSSAAHPCAELLGSLGRGPTLPQ